MLEETDRRKCHMMKKEKNGAYLLVDSFEGALSDFADETIVDAYPTEEDAIHEVVDRVHALARYHSELHAANELAEFPSDDDMLSELSRNWKLKYVSSDGCKYIWQIVFNPSVSIVDN